MIEILNWFAVSGWRLIGLLIVMWMFGYIATAIICACRGEGGIDF